MHRAVRTARRTAVGLGLLASVALASGATITGGTGTWTDSNLPGIDGMTAPATVSELETDGIPDVSIVFDGLLFTHPNCNVFSLDTPGKYLVECGPHVATFCWVETDWAATGCL